MYRLTLAKFDVMSPNATVDLPFNNVAPEDYCFYNVISETADVDALEAHAIRLGFTLDDTDYGDIELRSRRITIAAVTPINETITKYSHSQKQALVWVEIKPRWNGTTPLDVQETIAPITEEQFEAFRDLHDLDSLSISTCGDDTNGKAAVIIQDWDFYLLAPLYGYTWQSILSVMGVEGNDPKIFGFDDDAFSCGNCGVIDDNDDGYTYNQRETPRGDYVGVNCGCYEAACESEWSYNANNSDKTINLNLARKLATEGKLEFVARYIGGYTDPGRGGYFRLDDDATDAEKQFGASVCNGEPEKIMAQLLAVDDTVEYVFSLDDSGQFQTYFSVWKIIGDT